MKLQGGRRPKARQQERLKRNFVKQLTEINDFQKGGPAQDGPKTRPQECQTRRFSEDV